MQFKQKFLSVVTVVAIAATSFVSVQAEDSKPSWTDSLKISGDLRYRLERIDQEDREDRGRSRVRARLNISAAVSEQVKVGVRLASGSEDPTSTNQSFDKFGSTKDFGLDRAYIEYAPAKGHKIIAGKMGVPFYKPNKSGLVWDGDLNPEGIAYKFSNGNFFASAARFNLDECSSCDDSYLNGGQVGYGWKLSNGAKTNIGVGKYIYDINTDEVGIADAFDLTEVFADYSTKLGGKPTVFYANYVQNGDADELDSGYAVGVKYGKVKKQGTWDAGYEYKKLEANATFPLFTDSDFAGGGTDGQGHILKFGYAVNDKLALGVTQFLNERSISDDSDIDYKRTQVDFKVKF